MGVPFAGEEKCPEMFFNPKKIEARIFSAVQFATVITPTKTHRCEQAYPQNPEEVTVHHSSRK